MDNPFASFDLWAGLLGGMALFLFGMNVMTQALQSAAGNTMKDILRTMTRNRFVGLGVGALAASIIQSSSVTTVILVGFVSAGLMPLSQSVAVIMGANIGTTITAQLLAFQPGSTGLPLIAGGFLLSIAGRRNIWRQIGRIVLGLGLIFYGMGVMSGGMSPLRSYLPFVQFMTHLTNPFLAVLIGALFTAVVQSGSAVTGILIVMASQGLIALEPAIAITLGANVGSCVTALIASIGRPRVALRAAMVHVLFNALGATLWFVFIPQLADLARMISPTEAGLEGAARLIAETPRQIANAQTLFNLASAALFLGLTSQFARGVEWLFPDRPDPADAAMRPKYLDKSLLSTPAIALEAARMEMGRLGERVTEMVAAIMPAAMAGSRSRLEEVAAMDKAVDALHFAIVEYLGKISLTQLSPPQVDELMRLVQLANDLENLGDRLAIGMVTSAQKRIDEDVHVSADTARMLTDFHAFVASALSDALKAFSTRDAELAKEVRHRKRDLARLSRNITEHGLGRLTADAPNRLHTYAREMEIIEILDSVFNLARRIARTQLKGSHPLPAEDPLTSNR